MQSTFLAPIRPKLAMHELHVNGGPVVDFGVHQYDYWRTQFASEPVRVTAMGFTLAEGRPELASVREKAPDTVSLAVTFASGDIGVMTITWGLPPGIRVKAPGELLIGPLGVLSKERNELVIAREGGREERIPVPPNDERLDFFSDFLACIREDRQPWITARDGLAALEVAVAALTALQTGQAVDLRKRAEGAAAAG